MKGLFCDHLPTDAACGVIIAWIMASYTYRETSSSVLAIILLIALPIMFQLARRRGKADNTAFFNPKNEWTVPSLGNAPPAGVKPAKPLIRPAPRNVPPDLET